MSRAARRLAFGRDRCPTLMVILMSTLQTAFASPFRIAMAALAAAVFFAHAHAEEIRFVEVTDQAGLVEPLLGIMGHGGAWGDVDGDGRIDLFVGGFADRPNAEYEPAAGPPHNVLLRNKGDGRFERWPQLAVE